ncbi:MAG: efflux RND transporter periplasmic adaptor subunit [Acidobacteriota bacterium]
MRIVRILAAVCMLAAVLACSKPAAPPPQATKPSAETPSNALEITVDASLLQGLKVGEPDWASVRVSQTVAARIVLDETHLAKVGSPIMGRITQMVVQEGQEVRRGQLLAQLHSTGLSEAQLAFLKALSQWQVAQRAVERAHALLKADVIGSVELQRREADLVQASAERDAARDQLELMGMTSEAIDELEQTRAINSIARIIASMDGTVLARHIALGQVVQPGDTAFEVADLASLWLVADVPEQNAGGLRVGELVEAQVAALPGTKVQGTLSFVSMIVNPETRTVRVRMQLPNPGRTFKPSMLATVTLKDGAERRRLVPASAVVREGDGENVFVQIDADTFVLRPVSLGAEFEGRRVVVDGLRSGERIVLDGAFHLNNERRRQLLRGSEGA